VRVEPRSPLQNGQARVTFLGTGTSHGVPMIGCDCDVCRSDDPRDQRWRTSIYVELPGVSVLVDTGPDLRAQALRFSVARVDAILFTHSHADHVMGLDEVRRYNALQEGRIPCYGDALTIEEIRRTFAYIFAARTPHGGGLPQIDLVTVDAPFDLAGHRVVPVRLLHGRRPILGYRIGPFAYCTDCSAIPDESWPLLDGVEYLVLDALRERPHPTHFSVDDALAVVERLRPRRAWFTHIAHDLGHAATCARLPPGVELAYDGQTFGFAVCPSTQSG
jgi:phosphoribosyl 1,2-cyclic phosphate phosphodiesterase